MNKRSDKKEQLLNPMNFNLSDFKKWIDNQHDAKTRTNMIGMQVESKVPFKKLLSRMVAEESDMEEIANEFIENGGIISEIKGQKFLIEVDNGIFEIHRMYIKKIDD